MRTIDLSILKTKCLAIIAEVSAKREAVLITRRGEPIGKLVPVERVSDDIFGFFVGKGRITGDLVGSALSAEEWRKIR